MTQLGLKPFQGIIGIAQNTFRLFLINLFMLENLGSKYFEHLHFLIAL